MLPRNFRLHQPKPSEAPQGDASCRAVLETSAVDLAYREALARFKASLPRPLGGVAHKPTTTPGPLLRPNEYPYETILRLCPGCGYMQPYRAEESVVCTRCEMEGRTDV